VTAIDNAAIEGFDITRIPLEPDALCRVPRALALRHDILSLSSEGNQITIAMPDTNDRDAIDRVRLVTGMHVRAVPAPREAIRARLLDAYAERGDEAPAVRAVDELHSAAVESGASDIHVEPSSTGARVRQRIDGILCETKTLPADLYAQVVSRIKLLAGMDIADRRQPQDGRYAIEHAGRSVDARVSSVPTIRGEKIVVRLLDRHSRVMTLEQLGMPERFLRSFQRIVRAPHGFVVVCGPTGSGKTTTLYAALAERDVDCENLCSVEDPVEVRMPGVAQVQINPRAGVTFSSALRAFLRQDPDVIMVGEMRDDETAGVAATASLSGQLVLASLHANDAPKTIDRLIELGVARHTIAAGLTAVVSQRLVRRLCMQCRKPYEAAEAIAREFALQKGALVYRASGCAACRGTGYRGRSALFEYLFIDDTMRAMIADGASSVELRDAAKKRGYEPMFADGLRLALLGQTSLEELRRVLFLEMAA
jgi:type II secretory ATPase GspE/PulE/Tfp pilus assembly ATPase PilB-like protein